MNTNELRPCFAQGKKALFHKWEEIADIKQELMVGTSGGQLKRTFAIVEFEDGNVAEIYPDEIQFCDGLIQKNIYFFDRFNATDERADEICSL